MGKMFLIMEFRMLLICSAVALTHAAQHRLPEKDSAVAWGLALEKAEQVLRKDCGNVCLDLLHGIAGSQELAAAVANTTADANVPVWGVALNIMADKGLAQMDSAASLKKRMSDSEAAMQSAKTKAVKQSLAKFLPTTDTACGSDAFCGMQSLLANKCNYARVGLQEAYGAVNMGAHVMGVLINVLCGCAHVYSQSMCVLAAVPPICVYPYSVYSKMFATSTQLWEAVKASTKVCMVHGDAAVSS